MIFHVDITKEEFPLPPYGLESDKNEIAKCAKKLRQIVSEKVGLNCDDYDVKIIESNRDEQGTEHYVMEWDFKNG